jgi:hypothetical protein
MSTFSAIYLEFLDELEAISTDCHELTDTEVRERIASVLDFYFVWNHPVQTGIPKRYAMSSPQGDQKVREAVSRFFDGGPFFSRNQNASLQLGQACCSS